MKRRVRFLLLLGAFAATAALAPLSGAATNYDLSRATLSASTTAVAPKGTTDGGIKTSKVMCTFANMAASGAAGRKLKAYGSNKGWFGAILVDLFLSSVQVHCEAAVDRAGGIVAKLFRSERKPARSQTTGRSTILNLLDEQSAARIASGVVVNGRAISARYVLNGTDETCQAFRNNTPAMAVIARYFPRAKLDLITPMNGFVRLVISRCRLNTASANYLSGAMLNFLLANGSSRDLEPPTAWIYSVTGTRFTNGTSELRANWLGSDRGSGVRSYAVWMWRNGYWHQLTTGTGSNGWRITLQQGIRYQWAVRASDRAGNVSPWSYSVVYAA